jgi:CubicO group peptidase (beta-lactamase class C family)
MPAFLESFAGLGFLGFFLASSVVGARLLLLWRRTHELPELLIGLGVLGIGPVGFGFVTVGELCVPGAPVLAQLLIGTGLAAMSVGAGAKYVFNWRVYHSNNRVLRSLVVSACVLLVVCLVWEYAATGFRSLARPGPSYFLRIGLQVGCLLWGSLEALRYWDRMRRRVRIQLADPVVSNRFLLWGIGAGAAGAGSAVGGFMQWWTQLPPIEMPSVLLSSSLHGLAAAVAMWLAFVPNARYTRWIRARAAT